LWLIIHNEGIRHKRDHGILNCKEIDRGTEDVLIFEVPMLVGLFIGISNGVICLNIFCSWQNPSCWYKPKHVNYAVIKFNMHFKINCDFLIALQCIRVIYVVHSVILI